MNGTNNGADKKGGLPRPYSSYSGFKSFAHNGALSVEDIVHSLSHRHSGLAAERRDESAPNVEPVYDNVESVYEEVEPIYENVEPIEDDTTAKGAVSPHIRGFVSALVEGDRPAVFAGLRQHMRGTGAPEQFISAVVCLLDDAYRSRADGSYCDENIARLTARLSSPILEKLIVALTTAIDSSYSDGVTGAKLALTRALAILGA